MINIDSFLSTELRACYLLTF